MTKRFLLAALALAALAPAAMAQEWMGPVRGTWVQTGAAQAGDVTLASPAGVCEIVVAPTEHSAVQQAAKFLAGDIEKISGKKPAIVTTRTAGRVAILLGTAAPDTNDPFTSEWEAYKIDTETDAVRLSGSNFRGTAFAAYTLSERLGIDPLYLWTGYTPERRATLVLKSTHFQTGPPTFKYRGMFHDDEDILPRPIDPGTGYPYIRGTVPDEWYEKFFETALRLRMNQVAPFTRVFRPFHIQQLASDWGLFYTSHHYDILLSNPYGFTNFNLAAQRGVTGGYDYINNKAMVEKYWRAGVEENKGLDAIYPVGLRGTDDAPYNFPAGTTLDQKARIYEQVIRDQEAMAKAILPSDKPPLFHLTLYNEMMDIYLQGKFDLPEDVMLIWDDNGDGIMRGLPATLGKWKHGVYYHLAFFGGTSKQSVHTVTPMRIAQEFKKIVNAGATEYMLVNVSELREHVMETRMLAEIGWDAPTALAGSDPAGRYITWWTREYFGAAAAPLAATAYQDYYALNNTNAKIWYGSDYVRDFLSALSQKLSNRPYTSPAASVDSALARRESDHAAAQADIAQAALRMTPEQQQFFFEHVSLGLLIDNRPVQAARTLYQALKATDYSETWRLVESGLPPLQQLETEIDRAERPPFAGWYDPTWIRVSDAANSWSSMNVHRPYEMLTAFMRTAEVPRYSAIRPVPPVGNGSGEIAGDLRGLAVNANAGSPYYGYLYICDRGAGRVRIYRPVPESQRTAASAYQDTGLSITVASSTSQFPGGVYAPMGVSIGSDDTVWIADFSERQIEFSPPVPPSGTTVASTVAVNLPSFDTAARADLPAGWTIGNPRNVHVRGPRGDATVVVINNAADGSATDNTVQKFAVNALQGTVAHVFSHAVRAFAGTASDQTPTSYTATTDPAGNVYIALRARGGELAFEKLDPNGVRQPFPAIVPSGATDAAYPGSAFVADPTVPGGGYLYWSGRVTGTTRQVVYRFDLNGTFMDGFGPFFGTDILSGNVLGYMDADDGGAVYARLGNTAGNANIMKILRVPPYIRTGGSVRSSPAIAGGVAYFGSEDGLLYGADTVSGRPPAGSAFPVDIAAATAPGVFVAGRPAVRDAGGAMAVFFTTSDGRVGRVGLDGRDLRLTPPLTTPDAPVDVTPAVANNVAYVAMGNGAGATMFRVNAVTMAVLPGAAPLEGATSVRSSSLVYRGSLYVGTNAGIFRLTDDGGALTVQTNFGEATEGSAFVHVGAPVVPTLYAAGANGAVYARNAINFTPTASFGANGVASLVGEPPVSAGPYVVDGTLYVGSTNGKVYALREADGGGAGPGGSQTFFDMNATALAGGGVSKGLSAAPALDGGWNIVFGGVNGLYYQVRADNPATFRVTATTLATGRPFNSVPGVDTDTLAEFIGSDDGRVYRIPRF
jgi:hypothetical protein